MFVSGNVVVNRRHTMRLTPGCFYLSKEGGSNHWIPYKENCANVVFELRNYEYQRMFSYFNSIQPITEMHFGTFK